MPELVASAYFESAVDTPMTTPATLPKIITARVSDGLATFPTDVVNAGDGLFKFVFSGVAGEAYQWRIDGDPLGAGQTLAGTRYVTGFFSATKAALDLLAYNDGRKVAVHYDPTNGVAGTVVGVNGTVANPVNNEADMLTISAALGIDTYNVNGFLVLTTSYAGAKLYSDQPTLGLIVVTGQDVTDAVFEDLLLTGDFQAAFATLRSCFLSAASNVGGFVIDSQIQNPGFSVAAGAIFQDCRAAIGVGGIPVDLSFAGIGTTNVSFRSFVGDIRLLDIASTVNVEIGFISGRVELDASCVDGDVMLSGIAGLVDGSGAGCTVDASSLLTDTRMEELDAANMPGDIDSVLAKTTLIQQLRGLDLAEPMTIVTPVPGGPDGSQSVGTIVLTVSEALDGVITVTRTA